MLYFFGFLICVLLRNIQDFTNKLAKFKILLDVENSQLAHKVQTELCPTDPGQG